MISAGIKDLKNNLSRYLSRVKKGQDVLITERGKAIARIIREQPKGVSIQEALSPLVLKGLVSLPSKELTRDMAAPIKVPGKPISEMAMEDRR
jgi:antitoxin (DNA-binding transcriptional repressor) of toxin-antitoxin stability system